jgi:undecaprenyl-diphosphatase
MRPGRTASAVVITAAAVLVGLTIAVWVRWAPLIRTDQKINIHWYGYGLGRPDWVAAWRFVTHGGDTWFVLMVWVLALILLLALRLPRLGLAVFVAVVLSQVLFRGLRALVGRPRPEVGFVHPAGPGYPSSHAMGAATGAILLVLLIWSVRRAWLRAGVVAVAVLWAGVVGVSRVVLGAHWATDVLGAWLLAVAVVWPVYAVMARPTPAPSRA